MSFLLVLLVLAALFYIIYIAKPLFAERSYARSLFHFIDVPRPHWLFGHLNLLRPSEETILKSTQECIKYPKVGQIWFGPFISYLMLIHPHVVKPALAVNEPKDDMAYRFIRPWIGDGLLVSTGRKWHRNRRILTKAFHFDVLKEYIKVFNSCTSTMLEKLNVIVGDEPLEMFKHVSLLTLDSMLQCAISCETKCQEIGSEHKYISSVYTLTTIAMKRIFNPLCHNDFIFSLTPNGRKFKAACDYIHRYDEQVIQERKRSLRKLLKEDEAKKTHLNMDDVQKITEIRRENGQWLDFLDILILSRDEDGKGLSDREIRDEVDTFLFEGHDTTASGISWAFYCLAKYPEHQEKCREEIKLVLGERKDVEWSDLSKLSYLTMFIKEVLRLYSPVFAIARRTRNPITFPRGFGKDQCCLEENPGKGEIQPLTVQAPQNFGMPILMLHRNETVWNDPAVFDPFRFETDRVASRSPYAYLPFSAGPRNCIGQNFAMNEMKVVLARVLRCYRLYIDKDCPRPEMMPMIVLKSANGMHIKLEKLKFH